MSRSTAILTGVTLIAALVAAGALAMLWNEMRRRRILRELASRASDQVRQAIGEEPYEKPYMREELDAFEVEVQRLDRERVADRAAINQVPAFLRRYAEFVDSLRPVGTTVKELPVDALQFLPCSDDAFRIVRTVAIYDRLAAELAYRSGM